MRALQRRRAPCTVCCAPSTTPLPRRVEHQGRKHNPWVRYSAARATHGRRPQPARRAAEASARRSSHPAHTHARCHPNATTHGAVTPCRAQRRCTYIYNCYCHAPTHAGRGAAAVRRMTDAPGAGPLGSSAWLRRGLAAVWLEVCSSHVRGCKCEHDMCMQHMCYFGNTHTGRGLLAACTWGLHVLGRVRARGCGLLPCAAGFYQRRCHQC